MKAEYVLRVLMTPHFHDNANAPYFWCIVCDGANKGCGWEATPAEAFFSGKKHLNEILAAEEEERHG